MLPVAHGPSGRGLDDVRRETKGGPDPLEAAGEDPPAAEQASDLPGVRIDMRVPDGRACAEHPLARDHVESVHPREVRGEALGDAAAQPLVVRIPREVPEVEHGHAVRQCGRRTSLAHVLELA